MSSFFITFEGVEGAGKSTQIKRLSEAMIKQGDIVRLTREPGGTPSAEALRNLLVTGHADSWSALSECLLMNAARRENIEGVIAPALARGDVVICDRFMDSSRAYQGYAGAVPMNELLALEKIVVGECQPNLTIIMDLPVRDGLARALLRGGADRFEKKGEAYHQQVREGFLEIAKNEPDRCVIIDATQTIDDIAHQILTTVAMAREKHGA